MENSSPLSTVRCPGCRTRSQADLGAKSVDSTGGGKGRPPEVNGVLGMFFGSKYLRNQGVWKPRVRKFRTWRSLKNIAHIDSTDEVGSYIVYKKCAYFSFLSNRQSEMSLAEGILKHGTHGMPWPGKRSFVWKTLDL